jgi:CRISPR/Cas system-associated exonuclease Cas4 (RecB family)
VTGMILLALAVFAFVAWLAFYRRSRVGSVSLGTVVYDDAGRFQPEETLVSHRYGLKGRPDYIVNNANGAFPVEVKSRSCGNRGPYDGEKAQLFAYCLLVEELTGAAVRFGVIQYANREYRVPFGNRERSYIADLLTRIRQAKSLAEIGRSHAHARRCLTCGFRSADVCGQALISGTRTLLG